MVLFCFQVTSCIRNLCNLDENCQKFVSHLDGPKILLNVIKQFKTDVDVSCNVSRLLSVLTASFEDLFIVHCNHSELISALFSILSRHHRRRDIVVRVTFVLGNLAARSPEARTSIGQHPDTMTLLPALLGEYLRDRGVQVKPDPPNGTEDEAALDFGSTGSSEDTALKIIRVFANASIEPETGSLLALNEAIINELLVAIALNNHVLLLPTLATLNNLSFYPIVNQIEIYNQLRGLLLNADVRISGEAARVCGNLSRRQEVRNRFHEDDFFKCTVHLISGTVDRDLVSALVGIVINLMSDKRLRPAFKAEKGVQRSIDLLYSCLEDKDWDLACLVCQALW